ncbi:MAG: hypothetical protein J5661_01950 [Bacteroidaceae bacterium]|nr:hypothetical protein [Bacteroidaceae bacterium]
MDKLDKTYEAIGMLETLGLPVSIEQLNVVAQMEKDYLQDEIIPLIKQELEPMVEKMRNQFNMKVTYSKENGLNIQLYEPTIQSRSMFPTVEERGYRKKKFIIRVIFPDNHVSCQKIVSNTFADVVKYAGAKNVERLGIMLLGKNIISSSLMENERYAAGQQQIEPGIYLSTYCDTDKKLEIIKTINRELNLNIVIEKVLLE